MADEFRKPLPEPAGWKLLDVVALLTGAIDAGVISAWAIGAEKGQSQIRVTFRRTAVTVAGATLEEALGRLGPELIRAASRGDA